MYPQMIVSPNRSRDHGPGHLRERLTLVCSLDLNIAKKKTVRATALFTPTTCRMEPDAGNGSSDTM